MPTFMCRYCKVVATDSTVGTSCKKNKDSVLKTMPHYWDPIKPTSVFMKICTPELVSDMVANGVGDFAELCTAFGAESVKERKFVDLMIKKARTLDLIRYDRAEKKWIKVVKSEALS